MTAAGTAFSIGSVSCGPALGHWQDAALRNGPDVPRLSTGVAPLDGRLPNGGWPRGQLIEWLSQGAGVGAVTLALLAAREACRDRARALLLVDRPGELYAPALAAWGLDLDRTIVVRPTSIQEEQWVLEQALRCPGLGAVLCCKPVLDPRRFRRLSLAAEQGQTLGLLISSAARRREPSWATFRFLVEPCPVAARGQRRLRLHILRCRGGPPGQTLELDLDDATGAVRLAAEVASPIRLPAAAGH